MRSSRLIAVAISLMLTFSTSCKKDARQEFDKSKAESYPVSGGSYVAAALGDATYLNPVLSTDSASNDINSLVYNGLVKYDKDIQLIPELAQSWEITEGGRVVTFRLRQDVKWHDGQPFTSADVKFTFEKLIDPKILSAFSSDYVIVKKVETPDPYTFRVIYNEPFAPAIESWGIGIIPKHIWENGDFRTHPANRKPVGTGPYIFENWIPNEKITLRANPNYFLGTPYITRYIYRIIPDMSVQFLELRQGTWGGMTPTPEQYNAYDEFFWAYDKYHYPAFRYDYIAFNLKNPLFQDKRVRQAIAEAISKDDIIKGVYQGLAVPATGPFPVTSWAYNPDVKPWPYDPERAKALLAEAGWKDTDGDGILDKDGKPFAFTLVTNQGNKVRESIAQVAQMSLQKIGIKMEIRILEWSVFIHKYVDERAFEAVLLAWNLARDPDAYAIWHSSQKGKSQYNFVSYNNPEVDRLLELGRRTFGIEKRRPIYQKIHELIAADIPYVFLVVPEALPVVHKKFMGVELAPAGLGWNFEKWFIPTQWQGKTAMAS